MLRDISFDVRKGEFFGIVGRNGSGKSTLLKILAGIYRRDAGSVRTAGRVAPFIELGVGFDPELGKVLAQRIIPELDSSAPSAQNHDSSTNALIRRYREASNGINGYFFGG